MNKSKSTSYPRIDLERSERHYWLPLEYSLNGVFSLDTEGHIVNCNEEACQLMGNTLDELKGQNFQMLIADTPIAHPSWIDHVKRGGKVEEELKLVNHSGQEVPVWARVVTLYDTNGDPARFAVYVRDITENKRLDQLKDEFIGLVSHELRSPLTVIMGAISTALSEADHLPPEEIRQLLQDALWETESLSHLLGNLLELSRAQLDRMFLHIEPVNIRAVVNDTVERVKHQTTQHRFLIDIPQELPRVNADWLRLERILYNLLENAIKYSPKGGDIRVSARESDTGLVIAVTDSGVGLSPTDQDRIFGPFQRLEDTRTSETGGVGLGLLVCRRLVEVHGGRIWVESEPGHGATFFFTLPHHQPQPTGSTVD